ncbi:DUF3037 domain-containing protein [Pseudomonas sp. MAFF 311095]|uniref:DUF3037 domain-containing protein n=1 Tax=Pseudomonas petroselini TaxID=2899822 RepID=A0ABS8QY68_9PSED|nr:DUF3037 domain-containing protein [Pseudomonas petroselini]MCD7040689.1 DUF3037 domain-containing protein [Pseudomonas petroselini]MCD7043776.1 DUF3037 domain-containing protein [Pseudomonas petroselini]MCD7069585.1 DUF3037 domain-containing protein [Pseudomonas petroselini]MCD7081075.1 DUF3037 domain-containing protein [Pseudomonas petroselini]
MKFICNYSILRFLPYPETGEFVNIGIVLLANTGEFRFKIAAKRQRVTRFFETLEHKVYLRAKSEVEDEFNRLADFFARHKNETSLLTSTFKHLIHPRETMMRFSQPGSMAAENVGQALDELFEHYVNHSFANKEYQEKVLERQLGSLLASSNLKQRYKEQRLGTKDYDVRFPFVLLADQVAEQAIKPIFFGQAEPAKILEHGDAWLSKVMRLNKADKLAKDTLFIAEPPAAGKAKLLKAYHEVTQALAEFDGVRVISAHIPNAQKLQEIARGVPQTPH